VVNNYAGRIDPRSVDPLKVRESDILASGKSKEEKKQAQEQQKDQLDFLRRNLTKAASICADGGSDTCGYGIHQLTVNSKEFRTLNPKKYVAATINDLLLAAMHKSIDSWNRDHGVDAGLIRVQSPVNLRPARWQNEVMGNYIGSFPTNSVVAERESPEALISAIRTQTQYAKETGFGEVMYESMQFQSKMPAFLKDKLMPVLLNSVSSTSACVSNLGLAPKRVEFSQDKPATELWFSPPAAMPMGVGLGVMGYSGRLFFSFRYARALFDENAIQKFSDRFRDCVHWLC